MAKGTSQKQKKQPDVTQSALDVDTEMITAEKVSNVTKKPGKQQTTVPGRFVLTTTN